MKPARFSFLRPQSHQDMLDALAEYGTDASVIAGGQTLVPMMNMRLAKPKVLIEATRLPELAQIEQKDGKIRVGCGVRQAQLERFEGLNTKQPLLAQAIPAIGHIQTRARGTVCGSIAHADPSAELPLCLIALEGEVHLRSRKKKRTVKAADFFLGMMSTARAADEMIEAVSYPIAAPNTEYAFREIGRRHGDFAVVAVAAIAGPKGVVVTVGGVDDVSRRFDLGRVDGADLDDALNDITWSLNARDDLHASAHYRREVIGGVIAGLVGAHNANIAGPMTAICSSEQAGDDKAGRYTAAIANGVLFGSFGLFAAVAVPLVLRLPSPLIMAVAGLAMIGVLITSLQEAFGASRGHQIGAFTALVVAMSNVNVMGISSPFWALLAGVVVTLIADKAKPAVTPDSQTV